jgi:phage-related protein
VHYIIYAIMYTEDMFWTITYYSESVQDEICALPAGFLARYLRYTDRMEVYGPDLGMPHTRALGQGLFELRLKAAEGIARLFYCTVSGRNIVMLHQFIKKTDKTLPRELAVARRRLKEVKDAHS